FGEQAPGLGVAAVKSGQVAAPEDAAGAERRDDVQQWLVKRGERVVLGNLARQPARLDGDVGVACELQQRCDALGQGQVGAGPVETQVVNDQPQAGVFRNDVRDDLQ